MFSVTGKFFALTHNRTKFISEEIFTYKCLLNQIFGLLMQRSIKNVHRKHISGFKRFAEEL